jgi:hypothetical protein
MTVTRPQPQFGAIQAGNIPPEFFVGVDERFEVMAAPGLVDPCKRGKKYVKDQLIARRRVHHPETWFALGIRDRAAATTSNEMQILRSLDFVGIVACGM